MNAVEKLEAASAKLEMLKADSTPWPWHDWTDDLTGDVDVWHDLEVRSHVAGLGLASRPRALADAELIVTLHRTIDAQLAILRDTHRIGTHRYAALSAFPYTMSDRNAVALADAILGDAS